MNEVRNHHRGRRRDQTRRRPRLFNVEPEAARPEADVGTSCESRHVPLDFTAIDFETANGSNASACSVGLVKVRDGEIVDRIG